MDFRSAPTLGPRQHFAGSVAGLQGEAAAMNPSVYNTLTLSTQCNFTI